MTAPMFLTLGNHFQTVAQRIVCNFFKLGIFLSVQLKPIFCKKNNVYMTGNVVPLQMLINSP